MRMRSVATLVFLFIAVHAVCGAREEPSGAAGKEEPSGAAAGPGAAGKEEPSGPVGKEEPSGAAADLVIPSEASKVDGWLKSFLKPPAERPGLEEELMDAEKQPKIIKVSQEGKGEFKTITEALNSISDKNTKRVVINIGPGDYKEKIIVDRYKDFVTMVGDPNKKPKITFDATAKESEGTMNSATVEVEGDYFIASNIIFENTAPRPHKIGSNGISLRVEGDGAAFYNCEILGFIDTLRDDDGKHFFVNCKIQGTTDIIFGDARSIFLNCDINLLPNEPSENIITAHSRENTDPALGAYVFVHCKILGGAPGTAYLGRAAAAGARVIFAYTDMPNSINPKGWSDTFIQPDYDKTVDFGEYKNTGPGSEIKGRVEFAKTKMTEKDVEEYLNLDFITASKWLLPPPIFS